MVSPCYYFAWHVNFDCFIVLQKMSETNCLKYQFQLDLNFRAPQVWWDSNYCSSWHFGWLVQMRDSAAGWCETLLQSDYSLARWFDYWSCSTVLSDLLFGVLARHSGSISSWSERSFVFIALKACESTMLTGYFSCFNPLVEPINYF